MKELENDKMFMKNQYVIISSFKADNNKVDSEAINNTYDKLQENLQQARQLHMHLHNYLSNRIIETKDVLQEIIRY